MHKFISLSSLIFWAVLSFAQSGKLDPSFGNLGISKTDMGLPFDYNSAGRQVLIRPDGSIYIIFNYPTFISKRFPDGSIDSSYGFDGSSKPVPFNDAYAALQPDGKIVIVGSGFTVARINTDGLPDVNFGNNGIQTLGFNGDSYARSVVVQNDGKIVVGGAYSDIGQTYFAVARYNSNGSPDSSFNGNGQVITDFGYKLPPPQKGDRDSVDVNISSFVNSIAVQADGKIVAGGYATDGYDADFAVARYNLNGSPDISFDNDGKQTANFGSYDFGNSLAIDTNGKIVLAGYITIDQNNYFGVVRFNANGRPDSSFNGEGKQTADINPDMQNSNSVAIQRDNKIVVAGTTLNGTSSSDFAVVRFDIDGRLDNTFDNDGILTTDFTFSYDFASSVVIQGDDKIVVAGYSFIFSPGRNVQHLAVSRYNSDGSLDNSFADNGKLEGTSKQGDTRFNAGSIQTDRKIIAAGLTWNGTDYDFALARFNTDGRPDSTFNNNGVQITDFGGNDEAVSIAIQPDGKIVIAGNSDNRFALARYNVNGSPDETFNTNGKLITSMGYSDNCQSVALQNDGKIVVAGYSFIDSGFDSAYFVIARFSSLGIPDNTFNGNGKQLTEFGSQYNFGSSMAIQNNGKIVVAGRSFINNQDNFSLARYNTDGNLDTTFSNDGKQNNVFGPDDYFAQSLAIQSDGKIIVAGYSQSVYSGGSMFALARYNTNGDLDNTFNGNGFQNTSVGENFNFGKSVAISSNGKIAVGGTNDNYAIALYKNDGTLDSTFGTDGIQMTNIGLGGSSIQSLSFADNKLYAAGNGQFPGQLGVVARYLLEEGGPLPVSLLDFTAALQNKSVLLQWKIATEKNLTKFVIERSANGSNFLPINSVPVNGASTFVKNYSIMDEQPLQAINFYRLKIIDIDGIFTYSNIVAVRINAEIKLRIFPNPAQRILFVEANGNNENAIVQIVDGNGKKLKEMKVFLSGKTSFSVDVSNLPGGFYNLILHKKEKTEVRTFIRK